MPDHLLSVPIGPYLGLAWVAFLAVLSVIYRTNKGKPVLFWTVPGAEFIVHFASGHRGGSNWGLFWGVNSCLVVAVADGRLIVRPWFPFTLMFFPEMFGVECDVPLEQVVAAECTGSRFSIRRIVLSYRDELLQEHAMTLVLRDPERLLEHLPASAVWGGTD
jgi:hypothetical protein